MNIDVPCEITADPAISLSGESRQNVKNILKKHGVLDGDYVCVALREWKHMSHDFTYNMAKVMDYVCEKYNKHIVFLPMQYPADINISNDISHKMKNKAYVINADNSIEEAIGIIKYSSLVVAMRLHSLVYAVSCGVGVIAVKYDPKIEGFMEYFNQTMIADVENVSYDELKNYVDGFFANPGHDELGKLCSEMKLKSKRNAQIAMDLLEKYNDR